MNRFAIVLTALSSTLAFAPSRRLAPVSSAPRASSDDEGLGAGTINVALITASSVTTVGDKRREGLRSALEGHPFCVMTGMRLSISDVPAAPDMSSPWTEDHVASLRLADVACFEDSSAVLSYLRILDDRRGVPADASEEDRRALPNRLDTKTTNDATTLMAACPDFDTARECLGSGRWSSNHIYYPKDTQNAVELKILPISGGGGGGDGGDDDSRDTKEDAEEVNVDVGVWADSVVQAAGDVMERKFWGGGW